MKQTSEQAVPRRFQSQKQKSAPLMNFATGIDYQKIAHQSNAFAALLQDAGCAEGDFICCMTQEPERALTAIMGIAKAGCVSIPIDTSATAEEIQQVMVQTNSNWLLTDESVSACPDFLLFDTGEISLGWLGDVHTVPQDITPEFLFQNIEQYAADTSYTGHDDSIPVQCMIMDGKAHAEELRFGTDEIRAFFKSYDVALRGKSTGVTALFMNAKLYRLFSTFLGGSREGNTGQIRLYSDDLLNNMGKVMPRLKKFGTTRIVLPNRTIADWDSSGQAELKKMASPSVKEVVVLREVTTPLQKSMLKTLFPQSKVKEFYLNGQFHKNGHSTDSARKIGGTVNRIRRKSLEHWQKIFLGVVDEATFIQIRQTEFIRDTKTAYLNYWRKVEEENLLSVRHPIKLVLSNNI